MGGLGRKMIDERSAYYIPPRYSELPRYYMENVEPIHAAILQVSPMDKTGYFSFGLNASHLATLCKKAGIIIVEINKKFPQCLGGMDSRIHVNQVDYIVEAEDPLLRQIGSASASDVNRAVASLIVP